jgi:hypothetical protein
MGQSASGVSHEEVVAYAVSSGIPTDLVDVRATFDRYKDPQTDLIPLEKAKELRLKTDIFLTHDWGIDGLGRRNHDRVELINHELKALGFVTWFDSERMTADVVEQMVSGIDNASVIIVFITQRYMEKVNGPDANDNCKKEFKYATNTKSSTKMIPVVMEPHMKNIRGNWSGLTRMELANLLFVDFTNDRDLQKVMRQLQVQILARATPLWVLKSESPTPVPVSLTSPLPPVVYKHGPEDLQMIEELKSWFMSLKITSAFSLSYAEILVDNNTGSIERLQRKLGRNSNYLEEIGGFDEDDIVDIKDRLNITRFGNGERLVAHQSADVATEKKSESAPIIPTSRHRDPLVPHHDFHEKEVAVKESKVGLSRESPRNARENEMIREDVQGVIQAEKFKKRKPPVLRTRTSSESHYGNVCSVSWDPISNKVASGSEDSTVKIWDGTSLELLMTLEGHADAVHFVSWGRLRFDE